MCCVGENHSLPSNRLHCTVFVEAYHKPRLIAFLLRMKIFSIMVQIQSSGIIIVPPVISNYSTQHHVYRKCLRQKSVKDFRSGFKPTTVSDPKATTAHTNLSATTPNLPYGNVTPPPRPLFMRQYCTISYN